MNTMNRKALSQYQAADHGSLHYASPHELIQKLFDGALERLAQAKGAMGRGEIALKGELLNKAIGIISGLDACLDHDVNEELTGNLQALYEYCNVRLVEANAGNDLEILEEVYSLLLEIRNAWSQIPEEFHSKQKTPVEQKVG